MLGFLVTLQREYEGTVKKGILRVIGQFVAALFSFILLVCVSPSLSLSLARSLARVHGDDPQDLM